tara:strand:- start:328 stop:480 length:153 start_codon:yes stop_codon:yes gene_type:complete
VSIFLKKPGLVGDIVNFIITFTADYFGIDDIGFIKICNRFAKGMGASKIH